jgi:transcriptional regulator with PAS, ATPase and Fis domain
MDNEYYGSVIAGTGILLQKPHPDELGEIIGGLQGLGLVPDKLEEYYHKIPLFTQADLERLQEIVQLVVEEMVDFYTRLRDMHHQLREQGRMLGNLYQFDGIVGRSKAIQVIFQILNKVIETDATILIQGESGTGKELIAKAIHYNSLRKHKMFMTQNCSAFNDNLLESELFGHVRGSFSGAIRDKKGLFEVADGGTFFLDEVAEMSPALQVKLLRVIEEGTFFRVGDTSPQKVDVRIIAATNKDLKKLVEEGLFREDLYYRLNVINIPLPPLRDRKEDIPLLIEHFLARHREKAPTGKVIDKKLGPRALEVLLDYSWPGNIRELENELERVVILSGKDELIIEEFLSPHIREGYEGRGNHKAKGNGRLKEAVGFLEKDMILKGLQRHKGNKSRLARELGISRSSLLMKLKEYRLNNRHP